MPYLHCTVYILTLLTERQTDIEIRHSKIGKAKSEIKFKKAVMAFMLDYIT